MIKLLRNEEIKHNLMASIAYKSNIIRDIKRCLICNKLRLDENTNELQWETQFIMNWNNYIEFFTICPSCRKKEINEIFKKIMIDRGINGARK